MVLSTIPRSSPRSPWGRLPGAVAGLLAAVFVSMSATAVPGSAAAAGTANTGRQTLTTVQRTASPAVVPLGGPYRIRPVNNKCVDVTNASKVNLALIQQWRCLVPVPANQKWYLNDVGNAIYEILAWDTLKCLDVRGYLVADGTPIDQYTCNGGDNQHWTLIGTNHPGFYMLMAFHSGSCLDITGASNADGAKLQQWTCDFTYPPQQLFSFEPTQ